jgi:TonB family protein
MGEAEEVFSVPKAAPQPRWALPASLIVHTVFLVALLRGRTPVFIAPSSVLKGADGSTITQLYWDPRASEPDAGKLTETRGKSPLIWKQKSKRTQKPLNQNSPAQSTENQETASAATPPPPAGSPYGSLTQGPNSGAEIRPALPITTSEPLVSPDDLHGLTEGNVVVEITIDENGNIVARTVVQSLGPAIDVKVLAALENWRFRPATRDGVPIPSKQDVVYHFKPR